MPYYYKGIDPETKELSQKTFEDNNEELAIAYARENSSKFSNYTFKDENGRIIDSDTIQEEEEESILD